MARAHEDRQEPGTRAAEQLGTPAAEQSSTPAAEQPSTSATEQPEASGSSGSLPLPRKKAGSARKFPAPKRARDEFLRAPNEDDDGYDPYSDRRPDAQPLFERDPWN